MAHDVFISYSHVDEDTAESICEGLEQAGIKCWIAPRDIAPGAEWASSIVSAIDSAKIFVIVFSDSANGSKHVLREISRAVACGKDIITFKLTSAEPVGSMSYYLETVHWLDVSNCSFEEGMRSLIEVSRFSLNRQEQAAQTDDAPYEEESAVVEAAPIQIVTTPEISYNIVNNVAITAPQPEAGTEPVSKNLSVALIVSVVVFFVGLVVNPLVLFIALVAAVVISGIMLKQLGKTRLLGILIASAVVFAIGGVSGLIPLAAVAMLVCIGIAAYAAFVSSKSQKQDA